MASRANVGVDVSEVVASDNVELRKAKGRGQAGDDKVPQLPELLSAKQAAALLGVSVRQFWRWNSMGKVPSAVEIGFTKRWRRDELRLWIASGCPSRLEWEARKEFGLEVKRLSS